MAIENYEKLRNAMLSSLIESRYAEDIARLMELRSIEDTQAQPDLVRLITDRALSDEPIEFTEYPHARADLASRALYLNGFNPQGEDFGLDVSEPEFKQLIDSSIGGEGFVDDGTVKLLLKYQNDNDAYAISEKVKGYLDNYLNENLARVVEVAVKNNIEHEPVVIQSLANSMANPNIKPADTEPNENPVIPADELVSENSMDQSVAVVQRGDLDYAPDYRRDADREIEARKRISQIIANARLGDLENNKPSVIFVERRVIDKLQSFAKNKLADALDPVPLDYPSESLFSSSLSEMDDNGRVTKVHLHYRKDKVVMPSANSPKEVYDIMAAKILEKGIKKPYLKANFRDPRQAEKFIRETVSSLTAIGYDIEDMSVHPKHQVLFDNIKAEYLDMQNTIEEAPEALTNDIYQNAPNLAELNDPISAITAERIRVENPVPVEQFSAEQLSSLLTVVGYVDKALGVDENGDERKLTERNADTVRIGKDYVEKLIGKIDTERGLGSREAEKLGNIDPKLIEFAFADKPELLNVYEGFKANDLQNDASQNPEQLQNEYPRNTSYQNNMEASTNGFAPENAEPLTEAPPSPSIESLMDDSMYGQEHDGHDNNPVADHYDNSAPSNAEPQSESPSPSNEAPGNGSPQMSSADKYMMSMAQGAKKAGGDFAYMSPKQIKGVAVLNAMANLPDGKVAINDVSKATVQKIKDSVAGDIAKMVSGERVSKERYKAIVSQSDRVITELAGESGLTDLNVIKEKSKQYQNDNAATAPTNESPQSEGIDNEAPQNESPQNESNQTPQNESSSQEQSSLNIEGVKGQAMDDFELPPSNVEQDQEYDIPKAEKREQPSIDLHSMSPDDIAVLQVEDPAGVKAAIEYEMSKVDVLPDAQSKFVESLPGSVKVSNAVALGLQVAVNPVQEVSPTNNKEAAPDNAGDEPEFKRKTPKPKMGR